MSVTITKTPPWVAFAGNPVKFTVSSDNAFSTAGEKAEYLFDITAKNEVADNTFRISFADKALNFVLKTNVGSDPLYVELPHALDGPAAWGEKIYNAFMGNYDLNTAFEIEYTYIDINHATIRMTAREEGSDFTITYDDGTVPELVGTNIQNGVDPVFRQGFGILMKVFDGDKIAFYGEDFKSVDDDGVAVFNLSEYLTAQIESLTGTKFLWPETGSDKMFDRSASYIIAYFAAFAEKYEDTVRKFKFDVHAILDPRYALPGGLSREALVYYNNGNSDIISTFISNYVSGEFMGMFLTWAPIIKEASASSIEKLFFLIPVGSDGKEHILKLKVTFTDGTTHESDAYSYDVHNELPTIIECLVGYEALSIAAIDPLKTVKQWEVWIEVEPDILITEHRIFTLDPQTWEHERQLLFRNSLGTYDTIRITGQRETNEEHERLSASEYLFEDDTFFNAPQKSYLSLEQETYKASTGYLTLDEMNWLRDLMLSKEVYEIDGENLIPVVIESKKTFICKDKEDLHFFEFEYRKAFTDEFYSGTNLPAIQDSSSI